MRTHIASALFASTLAVGLAAQTVHLVGPGGYATIQQAVNAAAPDDIVHVQAGTYFSFTVQKSLRIRALGPVTLGTSVLQPGDVFVQAPVGATVDLVGFDIMRMFVTSGRASLDSCTVQYATRVENASLHLQSCLIVGGATAMLAIHADVTAVQTGFYSRQPFNTPGPLIDLDGSRFHASACSTSGNSFQMVELYLRAMNGSRAWWADGFIGWTPAGHCPLQVSPDSQVQIGRTNYAGAVGCAPPTTAPLLGVQRSTPLQLGQTFQLEFKTEPGAFVVLFAGPALGTVDFGPLLAQPSWLDDRYSFVVSWLLADAAGSAAASIPIPSGPGLADLTLWFKGISGFSFPLQVSPPIGGVVR